MRTIGKDWYLVVGQFFHWAFADHYKLWFTGSDERHRRTEIMLPRLVRQGKMVDAQYGKKKVYAVKRLKNTLIPHGLGVTETIVRIHHSKSGGTIIPERFFKGLRSVPDWGILYGNKLLLVEYSTQDNFEHAGVIKTKMTNYRENLEAIAGKFKAESATVLFVLDISRGRVQNFIQRNPFDDPYLFTDFETFKSVPFGQQWKAPIYFWGDGVSGPLGENHG